jgi:hypothetical protein
MTVRIDLKLKQMTSLDDVVNKLGDIVHFEDLSDLDPPILERMALLKISNTNDVIPDVGVRLDDNTYIVQQT